MARQENSAHQPLPLWLDSRYTKMIFKGNPMTLIVRPEIVDPGEWLWLNSIECYQVSYKLSRNQNEMVFLFAAPRIVRKCRRSFTWLDQNAIPVKLSAHHHITLTLRWMTKKIEDETLFPTDPRGAVSALYSRVAREANLAADSREEWLGRRSGFPKQFDITCQLMFRQMFRIYAHLYWNHFTDLYHLGLEKELNSCFSHFLLAATTHSMLRQHDLEPMQDLINLWAADGIFPVKSKLHENADLDRGKYLLHRGSTA
ncbi:protein kinase activator (Mob2) [Purpureocillium lilacinum]|uniref:Protein kinase activator (Mob2) n=1 Tax=Purpureocillium lilacinum TaxID=33203 RepID=A0A179H5W0_PURLI|nr:protein kinase activator (Mob2) [Purpureocillium lilacinum]